MPSRPSSSSRGSSKGGSRSSGSRGGRSPSKSKASSGSSKDSPDTEKIGWWTRSRGARIFFVKWGLPVGLASALLVLGGRTAAAFVHDLPQFQVNAERLVMVNRPAWLKPSAAREVHRKAFREQSYSIFDAELAERIKTEYEADPWVLRVESVSKVFPNNVQVGLLLRRPRARVPHSLGVCLVDVDARVLEIMPPGSGDLYDSLPTIEGLSSAPSPRGETWTDLGLRAGIGVLDALEANGMLDVLRVTSVDLSNFGGKVDPKESEIVLLLPNEVRILWGRGLGVFGEVAFEQKLEKIRTFLKEGHDIGGVDWNVRFENGGIIPRE